MAGGRPDYISSGHASVEVTATTTEGTSEFGALGGILHLTNDGAYPIQFNLDGGVDDPDRFTLLPGEQVSPFNRRASRISYKAVGGPSAFRALGLQ